MPIPQGLDMKISASPSPSKSASGPTSLSAVFSSHPPNRVPLGESVRPAIVFPTCSRMPIPQGLVTTISAHPSLLTSPTCVGKEGVIPRKMLLPQPGGLSPYCGLSSEPVSFALAQSQEAFIETIPSRLCGGGEESAAPAAVVPAMASIQARAQGSKCAAPSELLSAETAEANTVLVAVLLASTGPWNAPEKHCSMVTTRLR